ncbi:MAG TPA: alpha/beta hydrolase [Polyangiaceae bacterium]|nr:alpha/beta hydrolase [Polyangiaceae bacterium]
MPQDITDAIRRIHRDTEMSSIVASIRAIAPLLESAPFPGVDLARDLPYGPHERHRLDVFRPTDRAGEPRPVLLFAPGGGFIGGDKSIPGIPFYDNIGAWAARNGLVGVNINYRLAPQHQWPSGAEDVSAAVDWIKEHIADHGGDPGRIFVSGTSAGAVHVASYLTGPYGAAQKVTGAILLSCLFDMPTCERSPLFLAYFGSDEAKYPEQSTLKGMVETPVPALVALAELDTSDFERQTLAYVNAYFQARGEWPNLIRVMGHNHFTLAFHIGSADDSLAGQMLGFIRRVLNEKSP